MEDRLDVEVSSPTPAARPASTAPATDALQGFGLASPDLACIVDAGGAITSVNPAWSRVLGWTRRELVGCTVLELVHEDDAERTHAVWDQVVAGRTVIDFSNRWPHADGGWRWISWSMALGSDGRLVYASGRDITDRVVVQLRTAKVAVDLEAALSAQEATCEQLRRGSGRRDDTYLSAVSHELRTPLMLARGAVETLAHRRAGLNPAEVARLEGIILTQTGRLSRFLDQLLDAHRMGHGSLTATRRPTDLVAAVAEAIDESTIADRVSFMAPPQLHASVDGGQIVHIVTNLLDNAAKYAPEGTVLVALDRERDSIRLSVRDQGPGIPTGELEQVFQPFARGGRTGDQPGTGIGLALVAEFARLHGGRAWAEPTSRGAHLVVELPAMEID